MSLVSTTDSFCEATAVTQETREKAVENRDFAEHEQTFALFLRMVEIAVLHILSCLFAVAIGGLSGRWGVTLLVVLVATIAAALGATNERLGWRPGAAILALSVATFAASA
jgi:hypothetical protein